MNSFFKVVLACFLAAIVVLISGFLTNVFLEGNADLPTFFLIGFAGAVWGIVFFDTVLKDRTKVEEVENNEN